MAVADKHEIAHVASTQAATPQQVETKKAGVIRFPDADASPPRGIPGKPQRGSAS